MGTSTFPAGPSWARRCWLPAVRTPAPASRYQGRVRRSDWRHLRHLQQAPAGLLGGGARPEDDRRGQHALQGGQGSVPGSRHLVLDENHFYVVYTPGFIIIQLNKLMSFT